MDAATNSPAQRPAYVLLVGVLAGGALSALNETLWTLAYRWFAARADAPAPAHS